MAGARSVTVATESLLAGTTIQYPMHSVDGRLLSSSGVLITDRIKEQLQERGIRQVVLHPADDPGRQQVLGRSEPASGLPGDQVRDLISANCEVGVLKAKVDSLLETVPLAATNTDAPVLATMVSPGCSAYDPNQRHRLTRQFSGASNLINSMVAGLLSGAPRDVQELAAVATDYMSELAEDSAHVVALATELALDPEITQRSIRISVLGMAVAIQLGFDRENAHTVGVCGLVQDWGLFRLPRRLRNSKEPLTPADWAQLMTHPIHTADLLAQVAGISELARLVCYQVHECYDGTGYPNGLAGEEIHLFARILSVADAYVTITSNIRGRPAFVPYDAMVYILHQVRMGRFDSEVVRALLSVLSLYPVGSHVRLKDGTEARVVRANGTDFTRPIVQKLVAGQGLRLDPAQLAPMVDLSQGHTEVLQPMKTPGHKEMRIDRQVMGEVYWDGPGS